MAPYVPIRPVVPGGAWAPPDFGRSVNPISNRVGRLCPHITIGTPKFSDLPTALPIENERKIGRGQYSNRTLLISKPYIPVPYKLVYKAALGRLLW